MANCYCAPHVSDDKFDALMAKYAPNSYCEVTVIGGGPNDAFYAHHAVVSEGEFAEALRETWAEYEKAYPAYRASSTLTINNTFMTDLDGWRIPGNRTLHLWKEEIK